MSKPRKSAASVLLATVLACDHSGMHLQASLKNGITLKSTAPNQTSDRQTSPTIGNTSANFALAPLTTYASCADFKGDLKQVLTLQMRYSWDQAQYYKSLGQGFGIPDAGVANDAATSVGAFSTASAVATATSASGVAATATSSATAQNATVGTNLQVAGVDEADDVKLTTKGLYVADNQNPGNPQVIHIYQPSPLLYLNDLTIADVAAAKLYTDGDWLIAVGTSINPPVTNGLSGSLMGMMSYGYSSQQATAVRVYDVSSPAQPKLVQSFTSNDQVVGSRVINGRLFLVLRGGWTPTAAIPSPSDQDLSGSFTQFAAGLDIDSLFPVQGETIGEVKCTTLLKLPTYISVLQYQRVLSFDLATGKVLSEVTAAGNGDTLYMTTGNLYTIGQPEAAPVWSAPYNGPLVAGDVSMNATISANGSSSSTGGIDKLVVTKIAINDTTGQLQPTARGAVNGHLKLFDSQWAFNEMPNGKDDTVLDIVTSTGDLYDIDPANPPTNHFTVLHQSGNQLVASATLSGFGNNENVRAVRFLGDKAYVVTFERTDPLYTIDLSQPLAPTIAGELDIPGFSMYLQPHGTTRLIGSGFATEDSGETDITRAFFEGLLVQLFDVSNPQQPTRLYNTVLGKRGSYSEANQDAHAFYYDAAGALVGLPVVLFDDDAAAAGGSGSTASTVVNGQLTNTTLTFSGAIFYRIQDQALTEATRVSHYDQLDSTCKSDLIPLFWTTPITGSPDIRRIYRLNDTIYTVSNFAVKTLAAGSLAEAAAAKVPSVSCPVQNNGGGFE